MGNRFGKRIRDLVPILLLLAVAVTVLWKAALLQAIPYVGDLTGSDMTELNFPRRIVLGQSLHQGRIPFWLDGIHNGFPNLAEGQTGLLYPPNLILHTLLPPLAAFNYGLILNFFLAGLFAFLFARALGLRRSAALMAGLSFMLSGFFVARIKHVNMVNAAVWLPLGLYFAERFAQERKIRYAAYAGATLAVSLLAGHPHMTYYSGLAIGAWFLIGAGRSMREIPREPERLPQPSRKKQQPRPKPAGRRWVWRNALPFVPALIVMGVFAAGIAAAQVLPSMELTPLSNRVQGMSYEEAVNYPFLPSYLMNFVLPYRLGNPANYTYQVKSVDAGGIFWENCAYVGILALALGLLALIVRWRNPRVRWLGVMMLVTVLLSMGQHGLLFPIAWNVLPGMKYFRFPMRFLLISQLSLAVLGGFGLEWVMERLRGIVRTPIVPVAVAGVVLLIAAFDLLHFAGQYIGMVDAAQWMDRPQTVRYLDNDHSNSRVYTFHQAPANPQVMIPGVFWKTALAQAKGWTRNTDPLLDTREILSPDANLLWGKPHFGDRAILEGGLGLIRRFELEMYLFQRTPIGQFGWTPSSNLLKMLGMYNVRWITTGIPIISDDVELKVTVPWEHTRNVSTMIFENKDALPRAFVVPKTEKITEQEFWQTLQSGDLRPKEVALVEDDTLPEGSGSTAGSRVTITGGTNGRLDMDVKMTGDGYLVVSDNDYPGWQATLDGKPAPIARANFLSRAVFVPKGDHQVRMAYRPASFRLGFFVTLLSLLALAAGLSYAGFSRRKQPESIPAVKREERAVAR